MVKAPLLSLRAVPWMVPGDQLRSTRVMSTSGARPASSSTVPTRVMSISETSRRRRRDASCRGQCRPDRSRRCNPSPQGPRPRSSTAASVLQPQSSAAVPRRLRGRDDPTLDRSPGLPSSRGVVLGTEAEAETENGGRERATGEGQRATAARGSGGGPRRRRRRRVLEGRDGRRGLLRERPWVQCAYNPPRWGRRQPSTRGAASETRLPLRGPVPAPRAAVARCPLPTSVLRLRLRLRLRPENHTAGCSCHHEHPTSATGHTAGCPGTANVTTTSRDGGGGWT